MNNPRCIRFTDENLPVISLSTFLHGSSADIENVADLIDKTCRNVGCFFIADHGIDWSIVENCVTDAKHFFRQPIEEKMKYKSKNEKDGRGYYPYETQNVSAFMGKLMRPNDPVEKFSFGPVEPFPDVDVEETAHFMEGWTPNIYPEHPDTFSKNADLLYNNLNGLAEKLMFIFSASFHTQSNLLLALCQERAHSMKFNYYPIFSRPKAGQDRFAEHTDGTPFTILYPDKVKNSLMVKTVDGDWIFANAPPGTFFVNIGDCMARMTNDHWKATPHKVVFPDDVTKTEERLSFVFFVQMNQHAVVECIPTFVNEKTPRKYDDIKYVDFISEKLKRLLLDGQSVSY